MNQDNLKCPKCGMNRTDLNSNFCIYCGYCFNNSNGINYNIVEENNNNNNKELENIKKGNKALVFSIINLIIFLEYGRVLLVFSFFIKYRLISIIVISLLLSYFATSVVSLIMFIVNRIKKGSIYDLCRKIIKITFLIVFFIMIVSFLIKLI